MTGGTIYLPLPIFALKLLLARSPVLERYRIAINDCS